MSELLIDLVSNFLHGLAQQWGRGGNETWHEGSLVDEDDAELQIL